MKNILYTVAVLLAFSSCKKDDDEPQGSSTPNAPIAIQLESIMLVGVETTNTFGDYWDTSTNPPDPFVKVSKSGAVVYISTTVPNADYETTYSFNTSSSGALPIIYSEGESLSIEVRDQDSATLSQFMGVVSIQDAYTFFYNNDRATEFTDIALSTSDGSVHLQVSGKILY